MSHDENPDDEFDTRLGRLFAEKNEPLPANEFMTQVLSRLERAHRAKQMRRALLTMALLIAAAFVAPVVTEVTMELLLFAGSVTITPVMGAIAGVGMLVITLGVFIWSRKQI